MNKNDKNIIIYIGLIVFVVALFAPVFQLHTIHRVVLIDSETGTVLSVKDYNVTEPSFLLYEISGWLGRFQVKNGDIITRQVHV